MGSTAARKPRELSPAVQQTLASHHFTLQTGTTMDGAVQYAHHLGGVRLAVSMSPRIGDQVIWQWRGAWPHLVLNFPAVVTAGSVDEFERVVADAERVIVERYPLGQKVPDRIRQEGDQ